MKIALNSKPFYFNTFAVIFIGALVAAVQIENFYLMLAPFALLLFYQGIKDPQFLFFLLIGSLPFSFEHNFSTGLGTDIPDEPFMWMVSFIFFIALFSCQKQWIRILFFHPLAVLLLCWFCWMIISVLFSTQPVLSLKFILAKTWYMGAFVVAPLGVFMQKKNLLIASTVLVASMALICLFILLKHFQTGFRFETVNEAVSPFFRNHVNYGAMLVCMLPVTAGLYFVAGKKQGRIFALIIIFIFLTALFFSFSRGAALALLTGVIAWWLIRQRLLMISFIISIVLACGLIAWLSSGDRYLHFANDYKTTIFHKDFSQHLVSTYKLKDLSTAERFYRWIAGVRMVNDQGLTGSGPNTFYPLYKEFAVPAFKTWVSDNPEHSTVHNYFLLVAIEQGIPGLIFLLLIFCAVIYFSEKGYHESGTRVNKIIYAAIGITTCMIIVLNLLSDLIETDKIGSLFFLCIGILISRSLAGLNKSNSL